MIEKNTFNNSINFNGAKGLVYIGDEILVYRRDNNTNSEPLKIDLPGGGRDGNESAFETFSREVREEFGLEIKKQDIVYSDSRQSMMKPDQQSYFIVAKLPADFKNKIVFGNEGLEYLLITLDEYMNRNDAIKKSQSRVLKYLESLQTL